MTVLAGVASATAVTAGMSRPWTEATTTVAGLPRIDVAVAGADLAPLAGALGLVLLAAFGAVLATRNWARRAVGSVIVAAALVVLVAAIFPAESAPLLQDRLAAKGWSAPAPYASSTQVWRWLVAVGGAGCLVSGLLVVRRSGSWPSMGRRYDAPQAAPAPTAGVAEGSADADLDEQTLWRALDEGRDPTRGP